MPQGKGGFTLVELLIVMLIIVILAVSALPLLKPFVVQAKYTSNAVPVIGNLRTKIEVYRVEKDRLPGVPVNSTTEQALYTESIPVESVVDNMVCGNSRLGAGLSIIQTMNQESDPAVFTGYDGTGTGVFQPVSDGNVATPPVNNPAQIAQHVFKTLEVTYDDLKANTLRPQHIQYVAVVGSGCGEARLFAVGAFGDDVGLPKGTGYAVLEFNDPTHKRKFIATWKRWKPLAANARQIRFTWTQGLAGDAHTLVEGAPFDPAVADQCAMCPIPLTTHLFGTQAQYDDAVAAMKLWGWEL
jgi:prepilin-type N-terminal cleavage/methylation domain-containing protein